MVSQVSFDSNQGQGKVKLLLIDHVILARRPTLFLLDKVLSKDSDQKLFKTAFLDNFSNCTVLNYFQNKSLALAVYVMKRDLKFTPL